ncbi:15-hydroxyprostaglandin dehydrogenase [NAD(+)]-like [Manduca sexta]|nr:15-hydroxyprostaglandin dehydrogenase [NAD(+)]-like [Manduca sexta]
MNVAAIFFCLVATFGHVYLEEQLDGKVAVVTGGAKGIGYAIGDNFLEYGTKTVVIVDKNRLRGLKAEKDLNCKHGANRTVFIYGDITKDLDRVSKQIFQKFRYVNILVNNAGILDEYDPKKTIETNAMGTVLWADRFYNCMRKDRGGRGGTIINIASISAYMSDPFLYFYKASKFAVLGLTLGMGHEYNYLFTGVRMFAICPGATRTDMTRQEVTTVEEQREVFEKFSKTLKYQSPDNVGKAAVLLYWTATTGTAYTVQDGQPPIVSPDRVNITMEAILNVIHQ